MYIFQLDIFWITISPSYYGLMYALSFTIWYFYLLKIIKLKSSLVEDLFLYLFLWVILWWRFWYILFYNLNYYISNPMDIIKFWEWWMSFHWGLIWVLLSIFIFSKIKKTNYFYITDRLALVFPIWLFFGRIWNYINWELLWYKWYDWLFHIEKWWINYFPSTLLEAFLEWFILFIILNLYFFFRKNYKIWELSGLFLIFYWLFRFIVELFFRAPDSQIWYIYSIFSIWSLLSFPMIIIWIFIFIKSKYAK